MPLPWVMCFFMIFFLFFLVFSWFSNTTAKNVLSGAKFLKFTSVCLPW